MVEELFLDKVLQEAIDKLAEEKFKCDECKPRFIVSIGCDKPEKENPDLYCTCIHRNISMTRIINLNKYRQTFYSPFDLNEFIERLYNATM